MSVPFLNLPLQYQNLKSEIDSAIQSVIDKGAFAGGPFVEKFENSFAQFCGAKHCIGVSSGTSALTLLLQAHSIGPGDEVIIPVNTFIATAESVSILGATPVFCDCEESSALIDTSKIEEKITGKTKAIIPVHLYGQPADMDEITEIAKKHNLLVIEDACQAHGARYLPSPSEGESQGDGHAAYSFYPGKNLGAFGEAGGVTTNSDDIAQRIRMLRDHGQSKKYYHDKIGWNERMDGIQGAVLDIKLQHLKEWNENRYKNAQLYREKLEGIGDIRFFEEKPGRTHVYHLFVIRTLHRDELQEHLKQNDIHSGIHYPIPLHLQKAYEHLGHQKGDFPVAEAIADQILSLPMFPEMTEEQVEKVCGTIASFF
jgi:dTDP-4-amino-4,6-dideoxygalactose transaminase